MKPKTEHKKRSELKERKPNWQEYTATVEDIEEFLRNHVYLRHNVVTGRVECRVPDPPLTPPEREGHFILVSFRTPGQSSTATRQ